MPIKFDIDPVSMAQFQRALQTYQKATHKEIPAVVNRAAMNLAFRAVKYTPKADKTAIRSLTGVRNPERLAQWVSWKTGKQLSVRQMIAKRVRSIGFIRFGWLQAAKKLQSVVKGKPAAIGRKGKGTATLARASLLSFAEIINQSTTNTKSSDQALVKYGGEGLRKAMAFVANDMRTFAEGLLDKQAKLFNRGR